ncbi:histidine phosphatase family protein, partial [uncultured Actinomyces sp.]
MTDLILWRHGQTDYNLQGRIQGRVDIPLNETGREQARRAADGIAALAPTRIVSSPLTRARATAEVLASLTGLGVEIDPGLAEKSFGDWEGLKAADIKKQWPDHYATWR